MPRILALDLGAANVKATVWNLTGRKASFVERWISPVPGDDRRDDLLPRQMLALEAMLDEHPEARSGGVVIGSVFGGPLVSLTQIELPFTDQKQINTTLPFAVEDAVPFDLDERVMAWRVLSRERTTRTLVALSDEDGLREHVTALKDRNVEPRSVFADRELLRRWGIEAELQVLPEDDLELEGEPPPRPVSVVLDLGHQRTLIGILHEGELLASRSLDRGGAEITRAIAEGLRCSWNNAERLKCGLPAEPDPEPEAEPDPQTAEPAEDPVDEEETDAGPLILDRDLTPYDQLPAPGIDNLPEPVRLGVAHAIELLIAEIRSTLIGLEDSQRLEVRDVVLGGGTARLPGLAGRLQSELSVEVSWAANPDGDPVPCEYILADAVAEILAGSYEAELINLRAGALRWRSGFSAMQAVGTYGTALVLFFTIAMVGLYAWQSITLSAESAETQARIDQTIRGALGDASVRNTIDAMSSMRARIDQAKARASALSQGDVPPTVHQLYQLSKALPGINDLEIDVDSLTATPRALTFDAEVPSYAAADQVEVALQAVPEYERCAKSNEQQRRGKILFTVTCPLTDDLPEES